MPEIPKTRRFGVIPNDILNNKEMSLMAKGLFAYIQSKPDGWKSSVSNMTHQLKEEPTIIQETINELEENGFLEFPQQAEKKA